METSTGQPSARRAADASLAEHRRIRRMIQQVENTRNLPDLIRRLRTLRSVLVEHFLAEEAPDGLYDRIRELSPRQPHRLSQLRDQHPSLVADVDRLVAKARACLDGCTAEVLADARAFTRRVKEHEASEDSVLIDTLYVDLGAGG